MSPAKTLKELQDDAKSPAPGYDIHHIVERTPALRDGFAQERIDGPINLVRIPRFRHWEMNRLLMLYREDLGMISMREYLKRRDWEERFQSGVSLLRDAGVLQ